MTEPHQIQPGDKTNFETLKKAFANGDVALMRCERTKKPRGYVTVICMVNREADGTCSFVPVAEMCTDNPYLAYLPPTASPA